MLENETNPITFSCQATGEPVPTISWYFNGVMINELDADKYIVSSSISGAVVKSFLTILNTQSSDVGTYNCFAENSIGSDQSTGVLTINGKYVCLSDLFSLDINIYADAAEIIGPSKETDNVIEGGNITFRCVGVGYPPPLVQWSKLNGSLSDRVSSSNMSMSTNEGNVTRVTVDLIFTAAYREDTGVYECTVYNPLNTVTRNISLTVQCMGVIKDVELYKCFVYYNLKFKNQAAVLHKAINVLINYG